MSDTTELASYKADSGNDITLTRDTIRNLICDNPQVTDAECMTFAAMCKSYHIDPFIREAYLVKYKDKPAQMIVGKDYWMKQAGAHPAYDGMESGVTVVTKEGLVRREGTLVGSSTERLVGGWARVFRKDRSHPAYAEVSLDEYSTGRSMWKKADQGGKPATMIAKVAEVQALRKAFPETFSGLYDSTEMERAVEPRDYEDTARTVATAIPGAVTVEVEDEQAEDEYAAYEAVYEEERR